MRDEGRGAIARIRAAWDVVVAGPQRRALVSLAFASTIAAAHLGRWGTSGARALALGLMLAVPLGSLGGLAWRRRRLHRARTVVSSLVGRVDRPLAVATLRALNLEERAQQDATWGSPTLAELHLLRLLEKASTARLQAVARRWASRWALWGWGLLCLGLSLALLMPFRLLEGCDVLAARNGLAPLPLDWLEDVELRASPPDYLREKERPALAYSPLSLPQGSTLTFRGRPLHESRTLVLTDGEHEAPFVTDGAEEVVARWTLGSSTRLYVAARFGDVLIPSAELQELVSLPDEPPRVALEDAPRALKLIDEPVLTLRWEASDDHGLREVDLVLKAGSLEDRRVLSSPQSGSLKDRGGYTLRASDPFLSKSWGPISIWIEAKDNDPLSGPKWGRSEALFVAPPAIGEGEARRLEGLTSTRDALTDLLALRLDSAPVSSDPRHPGHLTREKELQKEALQLVESALEPRPGALALKRRLVRFVRGQLRRLNTALDDEAKRPGLESHARVMTATQQTLLALDAAVRALAAKDARSVAQRLSELADAIAQGLREREPSEGGAPVHGAAGARPSEGAPSPERLKETSPRLSVAIDALESGGRQLAHLGSLGADLGEIVASDLRRIRRGQDSADLHHAALAAEDLAARLRTAEPSFKSSGGHGLGVGDGGGGSTESGGPRGGAPGEPGASDEDSRAAEAERKATEALDSITREHAQAMNELAEALEEPDGSASKPMKQGALQGPSLQKSLERLSQAERTLAQRTRALRSQGDKDESLLPEDVSENLDQAGKAMESAARAMAQGDASRAQEQQRTAQRLLELSTNEESPEGEGGPGLDGDGQAQGKTKGQAIPEQRDHHGPEEFRRRVLEGLGSSADPLLREALKRYAEGLLR